MDHLLLVAKEQHALPLIHEFPRHVAQGVCRLLLMVRAWLARLQIHAQTKRLDPRILCSHMGEVRCHHLELRLIADDRMTLRQILGSRDCPHD